MNDKRYLIIVTSGKSGSYLLMSLLDGHPDIVMFPREENLVNQWLSIQKNTKFGRSKLLNMKNLPFSRLSHKDVCEYYMKYRFKLFNPDDSQAKAVSHGDGIDYSNINYDTFFNRLSKLGEEKSEIGINEWLDSVFEAYTDSVEKYKNTNPRYFAFKTVMPDLFARYTDIFPNAKFIHLVRHPYDVLNAYKRSTIINKKLNYYRPDFDLLEQIVEKKLKASLPKIGADMIDNEIVQKGEYVYHWPNTLTQKNRG